MFAEYDMESEARRAYKTDTLVITIKEGLQNNTLPQLVKDSFPGRAITDFHFNKHKLLFLDHRMYAPKELRLRLMQSVYDSKIGGHGGRTSTYDLLHRSYCWPTMTKDVN
jgi:hypothetical protein